MLYPIGAPKTTKSSSALMVIAGHFFQNWLGALRFQPHLALQGYTKDFLQR